MKATSNVNWNRMALLVLSLLLVSFGPRTWAEDPPQLMTVDELRPGMKGIGKTVFSGTTIEEFDVEIISVLKGRRPQGDAIMAKVSGGPLPLEHSGVLAGMSGSPVYIDGKLIGAIAFLPALFPKEPMLAGITPIHEMLEDSARLSAAPTAFRPMRTDARYASAALPQSMNFTPIQMPLMVAGVDDFVFRFIEEQLAPFHLMPVQGGGGAQTVTDPAATDLQPGSPVGIQLVGGDLTIHAGGTVTYRDQNKIIAFGHPMFGAGKLNLPMTAAYVNLAVPSLMRSFKMMSPLEVVGTLTQDQETGVSGLIGQIPPMLPLDVTIHAGKDAAQLMEYHFDVAEHPLLTPLFLKIASLEALISATKEVGDATIRTRLTIVQKNAPPFTLEDIAAGSDGPIPAILNAFTPLDRLFDNPFEPLALERVAFEMTVTDDIQTADIIGLRVAEQTLRPGDDLKTTITLRPYAAPQTTLTKTLKLPADLRHGVLKLLACDAKTVRQFDVMRANAKYQPQSLAHLQQLLQAAPGQNMIVLALFDPNPGAVVQGQELPSPPLSMMSLMSSTVRSTGQNSLTQGRFLVQQHLPTAYAITGCTTLDIEIDGQLSEQENEETFYPIQEPQQTPDQAGEGEEK